MYNSQEASSLSKSFNTESEFVFPNQIKISRRTRRLVFSGFLLLTVVGSILGILLGAGLSIGMAILAFIVLWTILISVSSS